MSTPPRQLLLATRVARLDVGVLTVNGKYLLGVLASFADLDGTSCRPSVRTLMIETGLARSTVNKALAKLRDIGALVPVNTLAEARRHQHAIEYRILVDHLPGTPKREPMSARRTSPRPPGGHAHVHEEDEARPPGGQPHVRQAATTEANYTGVKDGGENARARATPAPARNPASESRRKRMRELLISLELGVAGTAVDDWLVWLESKGVLGMWEAVDAFLRSAKRWRRDHPDGCPTSSSLYHRHLAPHWRTWLKAWNAPDAPAAAKAGG